MDLSNHDSPLLPLTPCATCTAGMATRHGRICERCAARIHAELDADLLTLEVDP
jgi:hypothetical protein